MSDIIAFTKIALPYGWLGNMSPHPVTYKHPAVDGDEFSVWRTSEALFQALRFNDPEIVISIWREKSPMGAKMRAKAHLDKMVVQPRSSEDLDNMDLVLRLKLEQHPDLEEELLETGNRKIVEDCSNRRNDSGLFWGAANVDGEWVGRNELGKLWEELRYEVASWNANHRFDWRAKKD